MNATEETIKFTSDYYRKLKGKGKLKVELTQKELKNK